MAKPGRARAVAKRELFWKLRSSGMKINDIRLELDLGSNSAWQWVVDRGGVPPRPGASPSGRFLTLADREVIAVRLAAGVSRAQIARELGKHPSTIGREIKRNGGPHAGPSNRRRDYLPVKAQRRADTRLARPKPAKLRHDVNAELHDHVQAKLDLKWSPVQIARRLPMEFPARPEMRVSHETIYQALYVQSRGALKRELLASLRTGRAIRRPKKNVEERRPRYPGIMISDRPAEVEDRAVPGHWEGDLIVGKDSGSAIGTLVERTTRFVMLLHLPGRHGAQEVQDAMLLAIADMPERLRGSLTWDQGTEMANHAQITLASGLDIYFCDPHSPWQRGSNENTNGLLRQYFPKSTDLSVHSADHLRFVADQLNDRPRLTLGFKSPREALTELLLATAA